MLTRREFLGSAISSASVMMLSSLEAHAESSEDKSFAKILKTSKHPLAILQGPTTETHTQLVVDSPIWLKLNYHLVDVETGKVFTPSYVQAHSSKTSTFRTEHVHFSGLSLGHRYHFVAQSLCGLIKDVRELRTLDTQSQNARIALLSCMHDLSPNMKNMWQSVAAAKPNAIFLMGDNVYGDLILFGHPMLLWRRYIETRQRVPLYHWPRLVPTFAIWDDHDYGLDNSDGHYEHKAFSLEAFNAFYAQTEVPGLYEKGPSIAAHARLFNRDFLFLDCRYHRGFQESYGKSYLGQAQLDWIASRDLTPHGDLWLNMGAQWFGGYRRRGESIEQKAPHELSLVKRICSRFNKPIYFASGDVHFSEVTEIKKKEFSFQAYEVTSSCLHSFAQSKLSRNMRRLEGITGDNFLVVEFNGQQTRVFGAKANKRIVFDRMINF